MVQVIYPFKQGRYPFGRGKQTSHTYMEFLLKAKDEQQVNKYRQLNAVIKKLNHPNIMHLQRVLKEEFTFHMIYEFQDKSLQQRLKELTNEEQLVELFVELQSVFSCLIERKLKAQLYLQFMAVDQNNKLKVWIKPDELQILSPKLQESNKQKMQLVQYYDTQRTRIHLEIQQIFQNSEIALSKNSSQTKQNQIKKLHQQKQSSIPKKPNFVIEGNTLVFLNQSQKNTKQQNSQKISKENHQQFFVDPEIYEQRQNLKSYNFPQKNSIHQQKQPDISKMSVAEKVLYYKKLKQLKNVDSDQLIVKDSSTSNASNQDISKQSNENSNMHIKTEMINKNKLKIITSEQVEVQGNSDDDLEKLARQKIAKIRIQKSKGKTLDTSHQNPNRSINNSGNSQKIEHYLLKGLDENSRDEKIEKLQNSSKQINSKIAQAKLKAKQILDRYGQKVRR